MANKLPKVGDCFYNQEIQMMGVITNSYIHPFSGEKVVDVEFPGSEMETEIYKLSKVEFHKGDKSFDTCFTCNDKNYIGELYLQ